MPNQDCIPQFFLNDPIIFKIFGGMGNINKFASYLDYQPEHPIFPNDLGHFTLLEIKSYLDNLRVNRSNSDVLVFDCNLVPILSYFQNLYLNPHVPRLDEIEFQTHHDFFNFLVVYTDYQENHLKRYFNHLLNMDVKVDQLTELDSEDVNFIKTSRNYINESLKHNTTLVQNFYFILFFSLYTLYRHYGEDHLDSSYATCISLFCLKILPQLIGNYRFGYLHNKLKDYALHHLQPALYRKIDQEINDNLPSWQWIEEITSFLNAKVKEISLPAEIKSRQKNVFSAYIKSNKYGAPVGSLWDLYAFRVILDTDDLSYCYRLLSEITGQWKTWPHEKGFYDYINKPKNNGYQSLHLVLQDQGNRLVELQIRTVEMDLISEFGAASHEEYKYEETFKIKTGESIKVNKGKQILERHLEHNSLTINDFVAYLRSLGNVLNYIPIQHYYDYIEQGKYNLHFLVEQIIKWKKKRDF